MTLCLLIIPAVFALLAFMGWLDATAEPPEMDPWK